MQSVCTKCTARNKSICTLFKTVNCLYTLNCFIVHFIYYFSFVSCIHMCCLYDEIYSSKITTYLVSTVTHEVKHVDHSPHPINTKRKCCSLPVYTCSGRFKMAAHEMMSRPVVTSAVSQSTAQCFMRKLNILRRRLSSLTWRAATRRFWPRSLRTSERTPAVLSRNRTRDIRPSTTARNNDDVMLRMCTWVTFVSGRSESRAFWFTFRRTSGRNYNTQRTRKIIVWILEKYENCTSVGQRVIVTRFTR